MLYKPGSIKEEPSVNLSNWRIYKVPVPDSREFTYHFVGFNQRSQDGRVSSKICKFDPESRKGITKSGRCYSLKGDSGFSSDAAWVWEQWKGINHVEPGSEIDVTDTYSGELS